MTLSCHAAAATAKTMSSGQATLMERVSETRKKLCHAIASLGPNATHDDVSKALDTLVESVESWVVQLREESPTWESLAHVEGGDGVTPLMVACDKAQANCIEYIEKRIKDDRSFVVVSGHPLDKSPALVGQNTAMHYAAMSGCVEAIDRLCAIMINEDSSPHRTSCSSMIELVSQRNEHSDTPLMMASASGQVAFLRHLTESVQQAEPKVGTMSEMRELYELQNNGKDTALSLASVVGHVCVVQFLVDEMGVTVTYDDMKKVEHILKQFDALIKGPTCTDEHRARCDEVRRCLVVMKEAFARQAQANMDQLLATEEAEKKQTNARQEKKKKAKRKPKVKRDTSGKTEVRKTELTRESVVSDDDNDTSSASSQESLSDTEDRSTDHLPLLNMADVVKASGRISPEPCMEPTSNETLMDVEAVMEALCLDASMLLLNPHDMALHLSPCQLDAIASVLKNQMDAVEKASRIQFRLRTQGS